MSFLDRLYRVFKANVQYHLFGDGKTEPPPEQEPFVHGGGGTEYGNRQKQRTPPPGQDAGIAQYYANLEIPNGSDLKTVRSAWKRLMRQYHPDLHSKDAKKRKLAEDLSQQLNHARSELEKYLKRR